MLEFGLGLLFGAIISLLIFFIWDITEKENKEREKRMVINMSKAIDLYEKNKYKR